MNKILSIYVYCIRSHVLSKSGTYVCFIRKNSKEARDIKVTHSTAQRLEYVLSQQVMRPKPIIRNNFVGLLYTIIQL